MKFKVERASLIGDVSPCKEAKKEKEFYYTIEINNLEELLQFIKNYSSVIIDSIDPFATIYDKEFGCKYIITIYDSWVE